MTGTFGIASGQIRRKLPINIPINNPYIKGEYEETVGWRGLTDPAGSRFPG
jgi:hypothetical protein